MQEDLEVTGISRSGRVRKKSSKLMDFESPDDIETRFRRQTPVKSYANFRSDERLEVKHEVQDYAVPESQRPVEEAGTASSESDYYDNNGDNADSMESDSSASDEGGTTRTPANSLYMMEKSTKKKLIVKDGRVVGRAKAQRKDKGKTRITAYMMWAKEARYDLLRNHPEMDFSAISKRLGEMWSNVNYNERYLWKRKAKRFAIQKGQTAGVTKIISNPKKRKGYDHNYCLVRQDGEIAQKEPIELTSWQAIRPTGHVGPGRPPANRPPKPLQVTPPSQALVPVSSAGAAVSRGTCGAVDVAAHLRLLGESLAIIGERLKEHEGQIAVSGSVSVLLDTLLCALAPLLGVTRAIPAIAPPQRLLADTLHNIAYIMPGL